MYCARDPVNLSCTGAQLDIPPISTTLTMGIAENNDVLEFLVEQIKNNVKFLKSKGRLSADAAQQVDALLSKREASTPFSSAATPEFSPPSHPPSALTAPAPSSTQGTRVRALYDYNVSNLIVPDTSRAPINFFSEIHQRTLGIFASRLETSSSSRPALTIMKIGGLVDY